MMRCGIVTAVPHSFGLNQTHSMISGNKIKFDPYCLHWSCSPSTGRAADKRRSMTSLGGNSYRGGIDQTYPGRTIFNDLFAFT